MGNIEPCRHACRVLREYGNISPAKGLFVLRELLATTPADAGAPVLSCAFEPELTLKAMLPAVCD